MPKQAALNKMGCAGPRRVVASLVACVAALVTPAARLHAGCPRTGGEQARRIVPSVLFWPAAPFILTSQPKRVPLPAEGAKVRVSARRLGGGVDFTTGRFVSLDSAGVRVVSESGAPILVPRSELRCLQVARRSAGAGALSGITIGGLSGIATGLVVAATASDPGKRAEGYSILPIFLSSVGQVGGAVVGSVAHATSWDTALDLTR
jgi:hypothetical protein